MESAEPDLSLSGRTPIPRHLYPGTCTCFPRRAPPQRTAPAPEAAAGAALDYPSSDPTSRPLTALPSERTLNPAPGQHPQLDPPPAPASDVTRASSRPPHGRPGCVALALPRAHTASKLPAGFPPTSPRATLDIQPSPESPRHRARGYFSALPTALPRLVSPAPALPQFLDPADTLLPQGAARPPDTRPHLGSSSPTASRQRLAHWSRSASGAQSTADTCGRKRLFLP